MRSRSVRWGAAVLVAGLVLLTGCDDRGSGSDQGADAVATFSSSSAEAKVTAAKDAMRDLRSIRLTGTMSNKGQQVELDLQSSADGRCVGTYGFSGGVAEVRATEDGAWMRPDAAIWKAFSGGDAGKVADFVGDKWVVLDDPQLEQMCDFSSVMDSLLSDAGPDRKYTEDGSTDVDGAESFRIKSSGPDGPTYGYVQADSPHYLLRTERPDGDAPATMTFSEFDAEVDVDVPAAEDIIDLAQYAS